MQSLEEQVSGNWKWANSHNLLVPDRTLLVPLQPVVPLNGRLVSFGSYHEVKKAESAASVASAVQHVDAYLASKKSEATKLNPQEERALKEHLESVDRFNSEYYLRKAAAAVNPAQPEAMAEHGPAGFLGKAFDRARTYVSDWIGALARNSPLPVKTTLVGFMAVLTACTTGGLTPTSTPIGSFTPTSTAAPANTPTPTPTRTPSPTPFPTATFTPTPYPTSTPAPAATATPTPTPQPTPTVTPRPPTPTPQPPTPTATATPTLEQLAQSAIDKYRNDQTTVITDYATIKPIVDAVLQGTGLKYDNIQTFILPPGKFNDTLCRNDKKQDYQKCVEALNKDPDEVRAFALTRFVYVREGIFYHVTTDTLREVLLAIGQFNYNAKSELSAEIGGNLGFPLANRALARLGYDPHNNVADTPENRAAAQARFVNEGKPGWIRSVWLINEDRGNLDRTNPAKALTAAQALDSYKFFVSLPDPDKYATDLALTHTLQEDNKWVTQVLQSRLKTGKAPSPMDAIVLNEQLFYTP